MSREVATGVPRACTWFEGLAVGECASQVLLGLCDVAHALYGNSWLCRGASLVGVEAVLLCSSGPSRLG